MAVCPSCQRMDKNFFAERCHSCNEYIGFWEQVGHSVMWTMVPLFMWILFYGVILTVIFG